MSDESKTPYTKEARRVGIPLEVKEWAIAQLKLGNSVAKIVRDIKKHLS